MNEKLEICDIIEKLDQYQELDKKLELGSMNSSSTINEYIGIAQLFTGKVMSYFHNGGKKNDLDEKLDFYMQDMTKKINSIKRFISSYEKRINHIIEKIEKINDLLNLDIENKSEKINLEKKPNQYFPYEDIYGNKSLTA
jgi:hypothetical protein